MKRYIFFSLYIFILASCAPATVAPALEPATETSTPADIIEPTDTSVPAIATFTQTTVPTETPILCDPQVADYCITDGHFIFQRPIQPPANDSVDGTYRYASTANGARDPHHGVEIGSKYGTPVHAAADGIILFAGPDDEAVYGPWTNFYGNMIVIRHADDLFTLYAHLSKIDVQQGDTVTVGQKIGEVGQSGGATGSHLHFEVRRGDVEDYFSTLNPELWLMPRQDASGALTISILDEALKFQRATLTIEQYSDANESIFAYYLDTYDKSMPAQENAALSDLSAGRYRITLIQNGYFYERWVEVQSGKFTQVVFIVK